MTALSGLDKGNFNFRAQNGDGKPRKARARSEIYQRLEMRGHAEQGNCVEHQPPDNGKLTPMPGQINAFTPGSHPLSQCTQTCNLGWRGH